MTTLQLNYRNKILCGDVLEQLRTLPDESVHMVCTSPPYWGLRSYGTETWEGGDEACEHKHGRFERSGPNGGGALLSAKQASNTGSAGDEAALFCPKCGAIRIDKQLGLEATPEAYVAHMVEVFREVRRVLRNDGTLWLNLGDSYAGSWGAQSRGDFYAGTLEGASSREKSLSARQIRDHPHGTLTGSLKNTPGLKPKDLVGIPWRVAFALQSDGWYLRSEITWCKGAPMPESVRDRPTSATEKIFLLSKSERYYYDGDAERVAYSESTIQRINQPTFDAQTGGDKDPHDGNRSARKALVNLKQNNVGSRRYDGFNGRWDEAESEGELPSGRNLWNYWVIQPEPFPDAHFATFPTEIPRRCIRLGSPEGGLVLDPFGGAMTTALVALKSGRDFVAIELNPAYIEMGEKRIAPFRNRLL